MTTMMRTMTKMKFNLKFNIVMDCSGSLYEDGKYLALEYLLATLRRGLKGYGVQVYGWGEEETIFLLGKGKKPQWTGCLHPTAFLDFQQSHNNHPEEVIFLLTDGEIPDISPYHGKTYVISLEEIHLEHIPCWLPENILSHLEDFLSWNEWNEQNEQEDV